MKKSLIYIIATIILAAFILVSYYLAKTNKQSSLEKNNDAVFSKIIKEYTYNIDGSVDFRHYHRLKILSYFAFHRVFGETFIVYNPKFQTLKINKCVTYMADGKEVPSPANAFNEVLPAFATNSYPYNHLREMVVTHTGLEINCEIELDYTIHSQAGFYPFLMANEPILQQAPVNELIISVNFPKDQYLTHQLLNFAETYKKNIKENKGSVEYKFINLPSHNTEKQYAHVVYPVLAFSVTPNQTANYFKALFEKDETNDSISTKVTELLEEDTAKFKTMEKIQKYISGNINYYPVPLKYTGFTSLHSKQVWNSKGGSEIEKTKLLLNMLKIAGFNAEPVGFCDSGLSDALLNPTTLSEYAVKVNLNGIDFFVSPIRTKILRDCDIYQNYKTVGLFSQETFVSAKKIPNQMVYSANIKIDANNQLMGNSKLILKGILNNYPYLKYYTKNVETKFADFGTQTINNENVTEDSSFFELSFNNINLEKLNVGFYKFPVPEFEDGFKSFNITYLPEKRTTALQISNTVDENSNLIIEIPENLECLSDTFSIYIQNEVGELSIWLKKDGSKVEVHRNLKINQTSIQPEKYRHFRQMVNHWLNPANKIILFSKKA